MSGPSLLALLRARSAVACDTLDPAVGASLGPFVDCTSNQAIALAEMHQGHNAEFVEEVFEATQLIRRQLEPSANNTSGGAEIAQLGAQVAMVKLALRMAPFVTGRLHVQANPMHAFDTAQTVADARRIHAIFAALGGVEPARISIKIPSTWEGLQACRQLEARGVRTLATTLFALEQAQLAAEVGCTYIAPYVNELKVHFEAGYNDPAPALDLPARAHAYFKAHGFATAVMPASLTSVRQCMTMAGLPHVTIAPALLHELARAPVLVAPRADDDMLIDTVGTLPAVGDLIDGGTGDLLAGGVAGLIEHGAGDLLDATPTPGAGAQMRLPVRTPSRAANTEPSGPAAQSTAVSQPSVVGATFDTPLAPVSATGIVPGVTTALERAQSVAPPQRRTWLDDEPRWRLAVARSAEGRDEAKLVQSINIFCSIQTKIEDHLMSGFLNCSWAGEKIEVARHAKYISRKV